MVLLNPIIIVNKGENKVARNGQEEPLKTGSSLFSSDQVVASDGAYIGLMHKTGKTMEIKNLVLERLNIATPPNVGTR